MKCGRCESVGRKPKQGVHDMIGPNGHRVCICDECLEEVQLEQEYEYYIGLVDEDESS